MNIIEQQLEAGILTITLNRPEKLNALSMELLEALSICLFKAKQDEQVKGLLLTGMGSKSFCAGADINRLAQCNVQSGYKFAQFGQSVLRQLETIGKPSLAAVNGYAFGGGCELAMAATLRIASENAQFAQPEVKLGVIPGYGGTQRLARLVGKGRALDLCLTGRPIDASTALQWGLVCQVVPQTQLIDAAKTLLNGILTMAPLAIAATMEAIDTGFDLSLTDALHVEAVHFANVCATADKAEGVAAFLEKRKAVFQGA